MTEPGDKVDITAPSRLDEPRNDADLLLRTRDDDRVAWDEVVRRYGKLVSATVRSFRLQEADTLDAVQMTWLRLAENAHRIQSPERLAGWLTTTARRECLGILRRVKRTPASIDIDTVADTVTDPSVGPEQRVIDADTARTLWKLVTELSPRRRILLQALFTDHALPYDEVARIAGIPLGSIGPTRARALRQWYRLDEGDLCFEIDAVEDVGGESTEGARTGSYLLDDLLDEADQALQEKLTSEITDSNAPGTGDAQLDDLLDRADEALRVTCSHHGNTMIGFLPRILDNFADGTLILLSDRRTGRSGKPEKFDDIIIDVAGTSDLATEDLVDPPEHNPLLPMLASIQVREQENKALLLLDLLPPRQQQGLTGALNEYTPAEITAELTALR